MASDMKVNLRTTEDTVTESSGGLMEEYTREAGNLVNNMGKEYLSVKKEKKREESGKTVNVSNG